MKCKTIIMMVLILVLACMPVYGLVFKQNDLIDLKVPCINNNTFCDQSTRCNITVMYPNMSLLVDNKAMTNYSNYYNYTISSTDTTVLGSHTVSVTCSNTLENGYSLFNYEITPSGEGNVGDSFKIFMYLIFLLTTLGLIYIFIINIGKIVTLETDIFDVAWSWSIYFVMLAAMWIIKRYSTDLYILDTFSTYIHITGFISMIVPLIGLLLSMLVKPLIEANRRCKEW